jgi:hypothetical protein
MLVFCEKWNIIWLDGANNQYALDGRIPGAERLGRSWALPEDAVKPEKHKPKEMSERNSGQE